MSELAAYPVEDNTLFEMYHEHFSKIWGNKGISYEKDRFEYLDPSYKSVIKKLLFFFACADKLVADNIIENFNKIPDLPKEADSFLGVQVMMEKVHAYTYADAIEAYIKDANEKAAAYNSIEGNDIIAKKLQWMQKWVDSKDPVYSVLAFVMVESIFFSSTFATIFWLENKELPLEGFFQGNKEILSDEVKHYEFSSYVFEKYIKNKYKVSKEEIIQMAKEAVEIEEIFIDHLIESNPKGIKGEPLKKYVHHIANIVINKLGFDSIYTDTNHGLDFMAGLGVQGDFSFFEKKSVNYVKGEGDVGIDLDLI